MAIKLSTGIVQIPIDFDNGEKGIIKIRPTDTNLAVRLQTAYDNILTRLENIEKDNIILKNDGSVDLTEELAEFDNMTDEQKEFVVSNSNRLVEIVNKTNAIMCEEIDYAFDSNVSSVVFKHCSPTAIIDGEYMIIQFLNAITPEIKKHIQKANKESEKNKAKHMNKYAKKK